MLLQTHRRSWREAAWRMGSTGGAECHPAHTGLKVAQERGCSLLPEVPAQRCGPTHTMAITCISPPDPAPPPALAGTFIWCFSFFGPHTELYPITALELEVPMDASQRLKISLSGHLPQNLLHPHPEGTGREHGPALCPCAGTHGCFFPIPSANPRKTFPESI